ncbi:MAG: hypothetical protein KGI50_07925 [Patescibacteria group bacterium]|nr:hypothetical protein [Patescibacteria group bacterium]
MPDISMQPGFDAGWKSSEQKLADVQATTVEHKNLFQKLQEQIDTLQQKLREHLEAPATKAHPSDSTEPPK